MMKKTKQWILYVTNSPYALWWIGFIACIESIFFPIPPDVFIVPLVAQKKYTWVRVGTVATIGATVGALVAYGIGYFFYAQFSGFILGDNGSGLLDQVSSIYNKYGLLAIALAAFTPVPDKLFTFGSGFLKFALFPYTIAFAIGKGARMFLFAYIGEQYGQAIAEKSMKKITYISIAVVVIIGLIFFAGTLFK